MSSLFKKIIALGITICGIYFLTKNFLPKDIFARLFEMDTYEGGSERTNIWNNAFELLNENLNWFFGGGWGSLYGYNNMFVAGHNTYISMLCDVGILGSVLFFGPIIHVFVRLLKEKQMLPLMILLSGLLPCFFLDAINKRYFWIPIFYIFIWYNTMERAQKKGLTFHHNLPSKEQSSPKIGGGRNTCS